jgi:spore maturation protein CgeB
MGKLKIVILGLSITSSWGNGHATTYRSLMRELSKRGHSVLFLERNTQWYADNRDLPCPPYGRTVVYENMSELKRRFTGEIRSADLVMVGSYVPNGTTVGEWVVRTARGITAFYDIDTPVTLSLLEKGDCSYLSPELIPHYHLYLSFTGGPVLGRLEREYGSPRPRPLYCSVDPEEYLPQKHPERWDLGYMGTYSRDRQLALERLMFAPARRCPSARLVVAGAQYPRTIRWPVNVQRIEHLPPARHGRFYAEQRFTLNLTRALMVEAGYSPSIRLFEAAACGRPIISDWWDGLDQFFEPGEEILVAEKSEDVVQYMRDVSDAERLLIGARARARVLAMHTAAHRAAELEGYVMALLG